MGATIRTLLFILMSAVCHCQDAGFECTLKTDEKKNVAFPDLFKKVDDLSYQMAVEYTMHPSEQTNYYTEYYDIKEKKGRVDRLKNGEESRYYYYGGTGNLEAFEISDNKCVEHNVSSTPEFMADFMYDWNLKEKKILIHGPSAMFEYAMLASDKNKSSVVYMGKADEPVRGMTAHSWRRCLGKKLTADYYFSTPDHEDVYGQKGLSEVPLRVDIYGEDPDIPKSSKDILPQNYDIVSFSPLFDVPQYVFELPTGFGCGREQNEDYDIDIPSFEGKNLHILGEVVFTDHNVNPRASYSSDFEFSLDISSEFTAYRYTPWIKKDGKLVAGEYVATVYDAKDKYMYTTSSKDSKCVPSSTTHGAPQYDLPGGNKGSIALTDSSVLFPLAEFHYLGVGVDRGYQVNIFEAVFDQGYFLGDRVISRAVVTHYYLTGSEIKRGDFPTEESLSRIRVCLNGTDNEGNKINAVVNFNLYVFTTQIEEKNKVFDISGCFLNDDDYIGLSLVFPADDAELAQIKEDIPSIEENIRNELSMSTEITPARLPRVLVDFMEGVYITLMILQRPTYKLDFDPTVSANTIISSARQEVGITSLEACATLCLENDFGCWGFSHCGSSCYIGTGEQAQGTTETKTGCNFYNRTNFNTVPRMETIRTNLEKLVAREEIKLMVPRKDKKGMVQLTASYVGDAGLGGTDDVFGLMDMETNRRLRVVKVGRKLKADAGEEIKHFGKLTYAECQSMCLDYRDCETVSYCISSKECIVSKTYGEDIPATKIVEDNYCNLLTRTYSDKFVRSPGNVLSQSAKKTLDLPKIEDCAKACAKETSFRCLSFDHCPSPKDKRGCRMHAVHILDVKNKEGSVSKEPVCGHYSRKYSYDFRKEEKKITIGNGIRVSTGVTIEQCAKLCVDFAMGACQGFDLCQDKMLTSTSCTLVTLQPAEMNTTYNAACTHFVKEGPPPPVQKTKPYSNATAGGVGFIIFVIGCFVGGLIVFGVAYYRVNRQR